MQLKLITRKQQNHHIFAAGL